MSKIKDTIEENKEFANTEPIPEPTPGYKYIDEKGEHLHQYDGIPLYGTSTITGVLNKPLAYWASGLAMEKMGWINKKDEDGKFRKVEERLSIASNRRKEIQTDLNDEAYLGLLDEAYSAHANSLKSSATKGTDLHFLLELYVKECMKNGGLPLPLTNDNPKIQTFIDWSIQNVKRFIWSELNCYSKTYHLGGISDCGFEDNEGKYGIIDFKSAKVAYDSSFIQIGGYDIEISENGGFDKNGIKTFTLDKPIEYYVVFPFGMKNMVPQYRYNVKEMKDAFLHCFELYKLINRK